MSTALFSFHEISTLGPSVVLNFTDTEQSLTLAQEANPAFPITFMLRATEDCYVRQGGSAVNTTTPATSTTAGELKKGEAIRITVIDAASNYLSVIRRATNGTLKATRNSSKTPGTTPS